MSFQFEMVPHSCLDLTLSKMIAGHLICRTFLKLGTFDISPDMIQVLYLGTSITEVMLSSHCLLSCDTISVPSHSGETDSDHSVRVASARLLRCTLSLMVFNKYFVGRYFEI